MLAESANCLRRPKHWQIESRRLSRCPRKDVYLEKIGGLFAMSDYSKYETIKVEKANRVATVTLNRPDSLNAVNPVLHRELSTIWLDLAVDEQVNAIIL